MMIVFAAGFIELLGSKQLYTGISLKLFYEVILPKICHKLLRIYKLGCQLDRPKFRVFMKRIIQNQLIVYT